MSNSFINRRSFLQAGMLAGAGGFFADLLSHQSLLRAAPPQRPAAAADACIVLWLNGGPSHIDTFDPKPGRKSGGPFKAIATRVPALQLCEHLPGIADLADRMVVVRGLSSKEGNHDRARFLLHTGYVPTPTVAHPALGAYASAELGDPKLPLPAFVSIRGPSLSAGFLGVQHDPFIVQEPGRPPDNTSYPRDVDFVRFVRRKSALTFLEERFQKETPDAKVRGRQVVLDKAVRMMYAPKLAAFDLGEESEETRGHYGENDFGRGCLLARRLLDSGVRYVEVTLDGWDTHQDNFTRTAKLMNTLDTAMAALLRDLEQRGRLQRTLILCLGEFGRTPNINMNDGRDHHPQAFSALLAGGGVRGGTVYGRTDDDGAQVVEHPVTIPDLFATVATLLGMDPDKEWMTPAGRPVSLTLHGSPIEAIMQKS